MDRLEIEGTDQRTYFPFPAELLSTDPPADEVISNLLDALRATVALPANPAMVGLAREALAEIARIQGAATLADISDFVAERFRLRLEDLQSKSRQQRIAFARQIAMYLCRKLTEQSFPTIGEHFHRDHSTVIHAFSLIGRRVESDVPFRRTIERIERALAIGAVPPTTAADQWSHGKYRWTPMRKS